jgi:hypothetical protein
MRKPTAGGSLPAGSVVARLAMYRLESQSVARLGREHFEPYDRAYAHFVGLYRSGVLAGR